MHQWRACCVVFSCRMSCGVLPLIAFRAALAQVLTSYSRRWRCSVKPRSRDISRAIERLKRKPRQHADHRTPRLNSDRANVDAVVVPIAGSAGFGAVSTSATPRTRCSPGTIISAAAAAPYALTPLTECEPREARGVPALATLDLEARRDGRRRRLHVCGRKWHRREGRCDREHAARVRAHSAALVIRRLNSARNARQWRQLRTPKRRPVDVATTTVVSVSVTWR